MNYYEIWCNLKDGHSDRDWAAALHVYLEALRARGTIQAWRLSRRKLGFGLPELGEFHVTIETRDLAQLDRAFGAVAPREGELERLHAAVYSRITDFRAALYRDYPDSHGTEP